MKMKYYSVSNSAEKETGSSYPQLHCLTQAYVHSMTAWEFPSFTPKLVFELEKSAKLTDVLSNGSISSENGFLVNEKVKNILGDFHLMTHKYYEATIILPKTSDRLIYYWLHLCQPEFTEQLYYEKSIFYETKWNNRKDIIKIDSFDYYKGLKFKTSRQFLESTWTKFSQKIILIRT